MCSMVHVGPLSMSGNSIGLHRIERRSSASGNDHATLDMLSEDLQKPRVARLGELDDAALPQRATGAARWRDFWALRITVCNP